MKIVLLSHSLRKGGAERILLEIANGLINLGHIVNVITWIDEDAFKSEYNSINRVSLLKKNHYSGLKSIPKSIFPLRRAIKSFNPDIIHIHSPNIATLFSFTFINTPVIHVIHGYGKIAQDNNLLKNKFINLIDVFLSSIIIKNFVVVSNSMKAYAKKYFYCEKFNFYVIENGIDINKFNFKFKSVTNNSINIIMIGTICENKGQLDSIVILELLKNFKFKYNLTFVGDGPDLNILKKSISISNLSDTINIIPIADNINELLHESHILWILSKSEAMPLVVLEALASGVAVVGYDVRGVNDTIINGKNGILTEYKNYNKIAESTIHLSNQEYERFQLTKNGRKYIESNFTLSIMINKYEELSKKILYG